MAGISQGIQWIRFGIVGMIFSAVMAFFPVSGEIQFDFFPGFRNNLVQDRVSPVTFEIFSENAPIKGTIRVSRGGAGSGFSPLLNVNVDIPAGTRKRLTYPVSFYGQNLNYVRAELSYDRGTKKEEREVYQLRIHEWPSGLFLSVSDRPFEAATIPPDLFPFASFTGTFNGKTFKNLTRYGSFIRIRGNELPDLASHFAGVHGVFLESAVIPQLSESQIRALITWVDSGGRLVISTDQIGEITQSKILSQWLSISTGGEGGTLQLKEFSQWVDQYLTGFRELRTLYSPTAPPDSQAPWLNLQIGRYHESVVSEDSDRAMVHRIPSGMGHVTVLPFSLSKSGISQWRNASWAWLPLFNTGDLANYALSQQLRTSVDASQNESNQNLRQKNLDLYHDNYFQNLVKSLQIDEIPVFLLIGMLTVYLIVIGPADWILLRRMEKRMLTWVTFPVTAILFSLVIYYVGFLARSGKKEWSAIHLYEMPATPAHGNILARTYSGIYSPGSQEYPIISAIGNGVIQSLTQRNSSLTTYLNESGAGFMAKPLVAVWTRQEFRLDYEIPNTAWSVPNPDFMLKRVSPNRLDIDISLPENSPLDRYYVIYDGDVREVIRESAGSSSLTLNFPSPESETLRKFVNSWRNSEADQNNMMYRRNQNMSPQRKHGLDPAQWNNDTKTMVAAFLENPNHIMSQNQFSDFPTHKFLIDYATSGTLLNPVHDRKDSMVLVLGVDEAVESPFLNPDFSPRVRRESAIYQWVLRVPEVETENEQARVSDEPHATIAVTATINTER